MDVLQDLLREVSRIVYQDKQEREDCWKRGENFNVFKREFQCFQHSEPGSE